jgi:hypothetical protein
MDSAKIYRETLGNLAVAINNHRLPDGRASLRAFCQTYGFNRPHLCQQFKGTARKELSVGVYLRLVAALGLCPQGVNTSEANGMSLRHYLKIDSTIVNRTILNLYSES